MFGLLERNPGDVRAEARSRTILHNDIASSGDAQYQYLLKNNAGTQSGQGRVLHDAIVYTKKDAKGQDGYIIEFDSRESEAPPLLQALKRFVLRSKVKIQDVSSEYDVFLLSKFPSLFVKLVLMISNHCHSAYRFSCSISTCIFKCYVVSVEIRLSHKEHYYLI